MSDSIDRSVPDQDKMMSLPEPEDFWLELGPASAYYGTDAYDTALREGDAQASWLDRCRAGQRQPG